MSITQITPKEQALTTALRRSTEMLGEVVKERDALKIDGPVMQRGTNADGTPWMGTMRECLNDYKLAADVEAQEVDRLNKELAALKADAERYRYLRDAETLDQWIWDALDHAEGDDREAYQKGLDAAIDLAMKGKS